MLPTGGTRSRAAKSVAAPEFSLASPDADVQIPLRTSSSPGKLSAPSNAPRELDPVLGTVPYDAAAEIVVRAEEKRYQEARNQERNPDAWRARLIEAERQRAADKAELLILREQYDLLALRGSDAAGAINVEALGASNQTCALPGCPKRAWPGHAYCGKQHAAAAALPAPRSARAGSEARAFPPLREIFQPPNAGWGDPEDAGADYDAQGAMGFAEPPPPQAGTFGTADPASQFKGLSKDWSRWILADPAKARTYSKADWQALGGFLHAGRVASSLAGGLEFVAEALEIDSEAAVVLSQVQDALAGLVESIQRSVDPYALRWLHTPARFEAIEAFSRLYENQAAGPKCMHESNINIQHQVAMADLKHAKSSLSKANARPGRERQPNDRARRYGQPAATPDGTRAPTNRAARGGSAAARGGSAAAPGAAGAAH